MRTLKRRIIKILITMMLTFSICEAGISPISFTVQAASKAPSVTEKEKTLYVGYKTHKIKIKNKSDKATVSFKSDNTKAAKVSKDGTVTPVGEGKAVITAVVKQNNKVYNLNVNITVEKPYIEMTASVEYLNIEEDFLFRAKLVGADEKVKWSVSDEEVAKVNTVGRVTAKKEGIVTVYAKAGDYEASTEVIIGSNRLGTFSKNLTLHDKRQIYISVYEPIEDETFKITTLSKTEEIIGYSRIYKADGGNMLRVELTPVMAGTDTIIISSEATNDRLYITVNVTDKPEDRKELLPEDIFEACNPSMVEITVLSLGVYESLGSGFFIDNGRIVTNYHVIEGAESLVVKSNDGKEHKVEAVLGYNKDLDLAILATDADKPSLTICQNGVKTGETVYALGSSLGLTDTFSKGMVTNASRKVDGVEYVQTDAAISPGNSGGPLLNKYGEVVGINTMYYDGGQNLNFSVSVNELYKISTNRPVTVKELYDIYIKEIQDIVERNTIYEDPVYSQSPYTSQEIPPFTRVKGTLKIEEEVDWYQFEVISPIYIYGIINFETMDDMNVVVTQIGAYASDFYCNAYDVYDEPIQYFKNVYLLPGWYSICVWKPNGYYGKDINYEFMLGYSDA